MDLQFNSPPNSPRRKISKIYQLSNNPPLTHNTHKSSSPSCLTPNPVSSLHINNNNNNSSSSSSSSSRCGSDSSPTTPSKSFDRFIPQRSSIDFESAHYLLNQVDENGLLLPSSNPSASTPTSHTSARRASATSALLQENLDSSCLVSSSSQHNSPINSKRKRLAPCFSSHPSSSDTPSFSSAHTLKILDTQQQSHHQQNSSSILSSSSSLSSSPCNAKRVLPTQPSRVLDAPELLDDYYLNLLDWSMNNVIAIALGNTTYLWNGADGTISQLPSLQGDEYITSVQWTNSTSTSSSSFAADAVDISSNILAMGTSANTVHLYDCSTLQKIRDLPGHTGRVSSLAWNSSNMLASGGRDSVILINDIRQRNNVTSRYEGHTQEVCGLKFSPDGSTLASGGNENKLLLWDVCMSSRDGSVRGLANASTQLPRIRIEGAIGHSAAVKALSWCPWSRHTLASGGGTADRTIRLWQSSSGNCIKVVDTGSQVCALQWSDLNKEIISSHGFSDNQLILWKHSSAGLSKIQEFRGHTSRVLHMVKSPNGCQIASASADETLRFWDIFGSSTSLKRNGNSPVLSRSKVPFILNSSVSNGFAMR